MSNRKDEELTMLRSFNALLAAILAMTFMGCGGGDADKKAEDPPKQGDESKKEVAQDTNAGATSGSSDKKKETERKKTVDASTRPERSDEKKAEAKKSDAKKAGETATKKK